MGVAIELIGLMAGILIVVLGIPITGQVCSLEFFGDRGTVKIIKIFTLLAYMAGIGAAFAKKAIFAVIAIAMAIIGYWVLIKDKE